MIQRTKVVVLQAPVSDREGAMEQPNYEENIQIAKSLEAQGKEMEMMPRSVFWAPITTRRFLDLQDVKGKDDFFSSDLTDNELVDRLSHVGNNSCADDLQVLVAFSGEDEYVPKSVDKKRLLERLCTAMNHDRSVATPLYLDNGNHNLSVGEADLFVAKVAELLNRVTN